MMNSDQRNVLYARVNANEPGYRAILEEERDAALKVLIGAGDTVAVYRAQGKVAFLDDLLRKMAEAHKFLRK